MSVTRVPLVLLGLAMLVTLSACGGGGGSTPAPVTPPPPDSEPDAFTIQSAPDSPRGTAVSSQAVTIQGINTPATVSIVGGEYSVNGGAFMSAAGTVSNAQSIVVRVTASATPGGGVEATLTVGSIAAKFTVTTSTDVTPPTATVVFPTARSRTSSPELIVRGSATDNASPVTSVRVNGVEATSTDNFATWTATVPLTPGANSIVVDAMDRALNRSAATPSADVVRNALVGFIESLVVDAAQNRIIATDSFAGAILSIDLTSGLRTVIANATTSPSSLAPNRIVAPGSLTLEDGNHALVLDRGFSAAIVRVDLTTGARTLVSGRGFPSSQNDFGAGTLAMSVDVANGRAYVLNRAPGADAILRVDLATGTRTVLSNATTPDAVNMFPNAITLALDLARNQLLVGDQGAAGSGHAIYTVNLDTGQRTILSSNTVPNTNNPLTYVGGFAIEGNRALVLQHDARAIYAVNLEGNQFTPLGDRTVYSSPSFPSATNAFEQPRAIAIPTANPPLYAYVADAGTHSLTRVDLPTGTREAVMSPNEPADIGVPQRWSSGVALDLSANRLYVTDTLSLAVNAVNLATGDRTLLSSSSTPPGPAWTYPTAVTIDRPNNRLLVVDLYGPAVYQVGLSTGVRQLVSGAPQSGIAFGSPQTLAVDVANNRALVTDFNLNGVVAVNLSDGGRTLLSGPGVPNSQNELVLPHGIAVDTAANRALVTNGNPSSVVAVDLATGVRSVLSLAATPGTWGPTSIAIDGATRMIVVGDNSFGAVHLIDAVSGNRTLVSNATTPRLNDGLKPRGIALDASRRIAWVSNEAFGIPQIVDLVTGERVFLTR